MAVVGSAYVVVRAITDKVESDIRKAFKGSTASAHRAGRDMGHAMTRGLNIGAKQNKFTAIADNLRAMYPEAEAASNAFTHLVRRGYVAQSAMGALGGSIGTLVGGLGALVGSLGAAAPALVALGTAAITARVGLGIATYALGGIGAAVKNATKPTTALGKSVADLTKEYEDLLFSAEDAALGVDRAALNLEKARMTMLRNADLAPNSMARRDAELSFKEADLAYRKALANREKLNDQVNKGMSGLASGGGVADPFAGLTSSQKAFAEYLVALNPLLQDLKESTASGFLPLLEEQIQRLVDSPLNGILQTRFHDLGVAVGEAVANVTDIVLMRDNLEKLDTIMGNMADYLPSLGSILGNLFDVLLSTIKTADPLTRRFIGYLEKKTGTWSTFLDIKSANGELEDFFNKAGDVASKIGTIMGQTFDGVVNIVKANFEPGTGGWAILDWLDKITEGWAKADDAFMKTYFSKSADNFIAMGDAIGGAVESLLRVGADPAVGQFWKNLGAGSYEFSQLLSAMVGSAPALGNILASLTGIIQAFADSSVPTTFLNTVNQALLGVKEIVNALKPLLDNVVGQIFAVASAAGLLFGWVTKIGLTGVGYIIRLAATIGLITPAAGSATAALAGMNAAAVAAATSTAAALAPIMPVLIAIGAVVAATVAVVSIKGKQMEDATKGVTDAFEKGGDAAAIWGQATKSTMNGPAKQAIDTITEMKDGMERLYKAQKEGPQYALPSTTALADSFGAMGRALADIAVTDLPTAQTNFRKFANEVGFSRKEMMIALDEMDEYKQALIDQADQMGVNIRNIDGSINNQRLLTIALGEGEQAINAQLRAAADANVEMERIRREEKIRFDNAVSDVLGLKDALSSNKDKTIEWATAQAEATADGSDSWKDFYDGQTFNLDIYLQQLEDQMRAQQEWKDNLKKLSEQLPADVYAQVEKMGESGAALVAALSGEDAQAQREKFIQLYADAGKAAGEQLTSEFQDKTKDLLNNITPDVRRIMNTTGISTKKDGGFIGFANGGYIKKFSTGGFLTGAGTGRSDSIPAMLSNGEFVVNSRATAQNRQLLEAINNNQQVKTGSTVTVVVNPSAEMNERELAEVVSRRIASEIRRGII